MAKDATTPFFHTNCTQYNCISVSPHCLSDCMFTVISVGYGSNPFILLTLYRLQIKYFVSIQTVPLIQLLLSLHHLSTTHFITPRRVCASRVKQLVLSVVVICHKKLGDSESITTSKWEDNDEIRRILAYVYLVEHKAVSFSASSTFF